MCTKLIFRKKFNACFEVAIYILNINMFFLSQENLWKYSPEQTLLVIVILQYYFVGKKKNVQFFFPNSFKMFLNTLIFEVSILYLSRFLRLSINFEFKGTLLQI